MANLFGGFNVTTPLASRPHNPIIDLSSNCIRDYFGSTCQTVFDCLQSRGKSSLTQLVSAIRTQCKRDLNPERLRLVDNLRPLRKGGNVVKINMARGSEEHGFVVDASSVRAALIVLLQHSMVKALPPPRESADDGNIEAPLPDAKNMKFRYIVDVERSLLLQRYPRYVEYTKKNYQEEGAAIVEELLVHGRMLTEEVILDSTDCLNRYLAVDGESEVSSEQKMALAQKVVDSLSKMIEDGLIEMVEPIDQKSRTAEDNNLTVDDLNQESSSSGKKRSLSEMENNDDTHIGDIAHGSGIDMNSLLSANKYKRRFPPGAVWRVNVKMFHASLRAFYVGRLVAERYGTEKSYGAIITAALKYIAYKEHSPTSKMQNGGSGAEHSVVEAVFSPDDIMQFLPPPILADFKNKAGGARSNLSSALVTLAQFTYPQVLAEVEEAQGHAQGGKFEITTRQAMAYLKGRILNKVVTEHHGEVPARMCSILQAKGHLESDTLAESAMVPAKDARELLHRLYKTNYVSLFYLHQTKQHNPANAIYLWYVDNSKIKETILSNTCKALYNLRLRRQHEVEVGKDWIERAKEADETDENESELDKLNYNKFCQGLERIDNACLQLDETLMILMDFDD